MNIKTWERKRKRNLLAFCFVAFCLGSEVAVIYPSAWFYVHDVIKADNPKLFHGLTFTAYMIGSVVVSLLVGNKADKYRNTRASMLVLIGIDIVGNVLYCIYYSKYFPLVGRFICGFGDLINTIIVGEIARCYSTEELTKILSYYVVGYNVGVTFSPSVNIFFYSLDFTIVGSFHINYGNLPGFYLFALFTMAFFIVLLTVSNLSRENDATTLMLISKQLLAEKSKMVNGTNRKDYTHLNINDEMNADDSDGFYSAEDNERMRLGNNTSVLEESRKEVNESTPVKGNETLKGIVKIIQYPEMLLLLSLTFVTSFTLMGYESTMGIIASAFFGINARETSIMFVLIGAFYTIFIIIVGRLSLRFSDFKIIFSVMLILSFGIISSLMLNIYHRNKIMGYILLSTSILAYTISYSIEEVLTRSLFAKLVPTQYQNLGESIRRSVFSTASIISGTSFPLLFHYLIEVYSLILVTVLVLCVLFYLQRKSLMAEKRLC